MKSWIDTELQGCGFADERLGKRFRKLIEQLSQDVGESIPMACQDWANTKAAYRFFSNPSVSEEEILIGHFQASKARFDRTKGPILVLHDTTELNYRRSDPGQIGYTRKCANRRGLFDQKVKRGMCGVLMHSSLLLTTDGLPLGFVSKKFWNREKFKNVKALYRNKNATRIPIEQKESFRWIEAVRDTNKRLGSSERIVHVGDREADMYELFQAAHQDRSQFLVRIKVNRRTDKENVTIHDVLRAANKKGIHSISYRDRGGEEIVAQLEIKFEKMMIQPSFGLKSKNYPNTAVTVISAKELGKTGITRDPIDWKLITNLPVKTLRDAVEKLEWYALRWKIEEFFKILKSGCKVDESKLRTAEGLCKMLATYSILAWRIFWMTMLNRQAEKLPPKLAITEMEIKLLDQLKPDTKSGEKYLSDYLLKLAKMGGYLARTSDPPPGNKIMWRGIQKLNDIQIGVEIGMKLVGN